MTKPVIHFDEILNRTLLQLDVGDTFGLNGLLYQKTNACVTGDNGLGCVHLGSGRFEYLSRLTVVTKLNCTIHAVPVIE